MNLLIYAINGRGMGHLNRTLVIARAYRKACPQARISFVVRSPLFGMVQEAGFEVIKIPDNHHELGRYALRNGSQVELGHIFEALLQQYRPHYVLIDFIVNEHLYSVIRASGAKLGLILRKQRSADMQALAEVKCLKQVELFLLPHDSRELPISMLPKAWWSRSHHLGPVVRSLDETLFEPTRNRYAGAQERLIVVSIGGGGFEESYRTLALAEQVAKEWSQSEALSWVIVYGPYYPRAIPESAGNIRRLRFEANLPELFTMADVVVCNAGYNTVSEVEVCGAPAVVIPLQTTGRDDQHERATALAGTGRALFCNENKKELASAIGTLLRGEGVVRRQPKLSDRGLRLGRRLVDVLGVQ